MAVITLEVASRRGNDPARERTFEDAAESYIRGGGEARYLPKIVSHFGDRPLRSIHPYDVREAAEILYPTASAATRNRQAVTPARAVLLHAYERGWCDPLRIRSFRQARPVRQKPASALWLQIFCRQADRDRLEHLSALILFMATTGARVSEAVRLEWTEVDLTARTVTLLRTKTTTNSTRHLTDDIAERMRTLQIDRNPSDRVFRYTSRYAVCERIRAVCRRAEIPYKSPHLCGRHTFATTAIELGVDIGSAMAAGEWRSSKVFLEIYVHPRKNVGRMVADRLADLGATEI